MDWYASQTGTGQAIWFRPEDRWIIPSDGISVEEQEVSLNNFPLSSGELVDLISGESYSSHAPDENFRLILGKAESVWLTTLK